METLGKYQNSIPDLKKLDLEQYERIFKVFETVNNGKSFYYYNILKKIQFPDNINSGITEFYTTPSTLPLTTVSYKIYNDIRLWWLILLINKDKLGPMAFTVPAGIQLKYINPLSLDIIFSQITKLVIFNGRHY
jgi:hypothetical protein